MISNVEHLSMCLLAMGISSLEKCLFSSSAHFLIRMSCLVLFCLGYFFDVELYELFYIFGY